MKAFKLDKTIDNQVINIQLTVQKLEKARQDLKDSLKKRKEISIQIKNYSHVEVKIEGLFEPINPNDKASLELLEKNKIVNE